MLGLLHIQILPLSRFLDQENISAGFSDRGVVFTPINLVCTSAQVPLVVRHHNISFNGLCSN